MRHSISIFLLSAGIVLSLAGCQKDPSHNLSGKAVRFSASSKSAETRTAFSGEGTQDGTKTDEFGRKILTWERIDWKAGDQVMIASDNAKVLNSEQNFATYTVETVTANSNVSEARVEEMDGDKELFFTDADSYTFWAAYPNTVAVGSTLATGKVNFAISNQVSAGTETIIKEGKTLTVLKPDMTQAVMLAKKDNVTSEAVDLEFYPAFTAFEFTLLAKEDVEIPLQKVIFSSSSALTGSVAATINTGAPNYDDYTITPSNDGKLTYTFPSGTVVSKTKYLTFTFFALPQDIEGLTMEFYMGSGNNVTVKKGTLKKNNQDITFAAGKKHSLRGVALESGWEFSYLTLDLQVLDWEAVDVEGQSSEFPQATQFNVSGTGVLNGYTDIHNSTGDKDPWRQSWYFKDEQTVVVYFRVMLPAGGTWEVELVGGTEENPVPADAALFTVKNVSPAIDEDTPTVESNLYGPMHQTGSTEVELEITYNGPANEAHSCYLHTYVYSGANKTGTKFNIDSETQIYDRGRGYHTFYVNNSLYPNN